MNGNDVVNISQEPLFHGPAKGAKVLKGVSADDFLIRLEAIRTHGDVAMADNLIVKRAVSYFRDTANQWWTKTSHITEKAERKLAETNWEIFVSLFRERFCTGATRKDLTNVYEGLEQYEGESASDCMERIATALQTHTEVLVLPTLSTEFLEEHRENRDAILDDTKVEREGVQHLLSDNTQTRLDRETIRVATECSKMTRETVLLDLGLKLAVMAIKDRDALTKIKELDRRSMPFDRIIKEIKDWEAISMSKTGKIRVYQNGNNHNNRQRGKNGNGNGHVKAVAAPEASDDEDDDEETAAAIAAIRKAKADRKKKARNKGGNKNGNEEIEEKQRKKNNKANVTCYNCGEKGHYSPRCPKKFDVKSETAEAGTATTTSMSQGKKKTDFQ